ncbi:MAG TPA: PD-(D/E)XK nuclease family protein [Myxococcota bacterium]|nr:PD-(D/E)XK nuclease family protein [Myxococcota bacterium]
MREPNEGPGETTGDVYSHSRLSAFERCPRKFQYRYVWKLPAEGESIEGFVGKRVHEVLERLHRTAETHGVPTLPRVIWRFQQMFAEAYDASRVRIAREGMPPDFYRAFGEQCLRNYYDEHYPFDRDETLALEERVQFDLGDGGAYSVQGFVDRIARTRDGAIEIQDYKTSARAPSQEQVDGDRQLALYQIGIGARFGAHRPVRLVWRYLRHRRTLVSTRTPEQLTLLAAQTRALIDRIRSETVFEPRPSALCRWCEYREGCPASPERRADRPAYAPRRARAPEAPAQLALMF